MGDTVGVSLMVDTVGGIQQTATVVGHCARACSACPVTTLKVYRIINGGSVDSQWILLGCMLLSIEEIEIVTRVINPALKSKLTTVFVGRRYISFLIWSWHRATP